MKTKTINGVVYCFAKVPKGITVVKIRKAEYGDVLYYTRPNVGAPLAGRIPLPSGNYELIGKASEITEETARELFGESLASLISSLEMKIEETVVLKQLPE